MMFSIKDFFGKCDAVNLRVSIWDIKNSEYKKLLGVKHDNKLTFEKPITHICRKASRKTYALAMHNI